MHLTAIHPRCPESAVGFGIASAAPLAATEPSDLEHPRTPQQAQKRHNEAIDEGCMAMTLFRTRRSVFRRRLIGGKYVLV
jgi:hypothetical protein